MKNKKNLKSLIEECAFSLTDAFIEKKRNELAKIGTTSEEFINLYNENMLGFYLDIILGLDKTMYISMEKMDFRVPQSFDNLLKYSFKSSEDWCGKITNAICRLGYPYFGHCLICVPYDGQWTNNIPYLLVADKRLVKDLKETTTSPETDYCNNGYFGYSEGRFSGFIPYLFKKGYIDLLDKVLDFIFGESIACGDHMAFIMVNLLNFLRVNGLKQWYEKIYVKFKHVQLAFDGVDWNNKLFYLSGISRHLLKEETKSLTIDEALKI